MHRVLALLTALTSWLVSPNADAVAVRVRAQPEFSSVQATPRAGTTHVTGSLRDEVDGPVGGARISIDCEPACTATACESGSPEVITDETGAFCFSIDGRAPLRARLSSAATPYLEAAERDVPLRDRPTLKVQLITARTWALADADHPVRIQLEAHSNDEERYRVRLRLLRPEREPVDLGAAQTLSVQRAAEFSVPSNSLGTPGAATLQALLGDDPSAPLATETVPLVIVSSVTLAWDALPASVLPELGFEVRLRAQALGAPVDGGAVEVLVGDERICAADVAGGLANLQCRFLAPGAEMLALRARYVPQQAWWRPGPELFIELPIKRAPGWLYAPWIVVGIVAAVWIFRAWWRPARAATSAPAVASPPVAGVVSVAAVGSSASSFHGRVVDAHTQEPIVGARLRILLPSVTTEHVAASTYTDAEGRFALEAPETSVEGSRLEIEAPEHSRLRAPLPALGALQIQMTSRRRALLAHLSDWARTRRWQTARAVTPGEVARLARRSTEPETERWALDLEAAVFGIAPPGEPEEDALKSRTPAATNSLPFKR